ncbi:hypothetical protein B0T14DRAFT_602789 [Immersiella caudata]|uniref:Uncharacterized protein n=1 Tax=Immersiella caudata TaxID=314043 RepID=A0AA40BYW6_9PEZI|nr:hypothetical protein B0T14DRAFT_602789 [Immersiella caudata]
MARVDPDIQHHRLGVVAVNLTVSIYMNIRASGASLASSGTLSSGSCNEINHTKAWIQVITNAASMALLAATPWSLSEKVELDCRVLSSPMFWWLIIICNILIASLITGMIFFYKSTPLATVGDVIDSYLRTPSSERPSAASTYDYTSSKNMDRPKLEAWSFQPKKRRLRRAAGGMRWGITLVWWMASLFAVAAGFTQTLRAEKEYADTSMAGMRVKYLQTLKRANSGSFARGFDSLRRVSMAPPSPTGTSSTTRRLQFITLAKPPVLTGFLGTTLLMILIITGYYFIAFQPDQDPFNPLGEKKGPHDRPWRVNPIDEYLINLIGPCKRRVTGWLRIDPTTGTDCKRLEDAFNDCVLSFCDLQVLAGIGVIVSAYGILKAGVSAFHWQMAVFLAWYANLTHQTGLTMLRKYLNRPGRGLERHCRVLAMAVLFILLLVAMVPTAYFNWTSFRPHAAHPGSYAWCYFHLSIANQLFENASSSGAKLEGTRGLQNTVISMLLLAFTFGTKIIRLSKRLSTLANVRVRGRISKWLQKRIQTASGSPMSQLRRTRWRRPVGSCSFLKWHLVAKPLIALYLAGRISADLFTSMISEVYWLWVSTAWLTVALFRTRQSVDLDENSFAFGQILPVLLLAGPLEPIVVTFFSVTYGNGDAQRAISPAAGDRRDSESRALDIADSTLAVDDASEARRQEEGMYNGNGVGADGAAPVSPSPNDSLSIRPANAKRSNTYSQHRDPGMKWAILLMIFQVLIATGVTLGFLSATPLSAVRAVQPFVIWFVVTLPSAFYLMVLLCIETCGSRWPSKAGFAILALYSSLLNPGFLDKIMSSQDPLSRHGHIWTPVLLATGFGLLVMNPIFVVLVVCFRRLQGLLYKSNLAT